MLCLDAFYYFLFLVPFMSSFLTIITLGVGMGQTKNYYVGYTRRGQPQASYGLIHTGKATQGKYGVMRESHALRCLVAHTGICCVSVMFIRLLGLFNLWMLSRFLEPEDSKSESASLSAVPLRMANMDRSPERRERVS
ncbi:hypothetical protein BO86DRAFT_41285 [Aspergillus japonicus CBS 114.51]|uniref:Uncharacterized protein n=1 Tax=Aspergillus japonicus CBS 114.51 TaxID=1448312 RepID=A0A8T8X7B8_ASPJA|nr:hypothetical protein BO86DRAFT_41285 [Aspergillus japonicus CBS 114.51]RAH83532.1 hypothetical protein BO86DRAFT_41285 [Aspergillus japonicus CBS 114.51]